jgi:GST-like protein
MAAMIDVYTWPTPNGHKVHIALEEMGLPYTVRAVDIGAGDQFKPEFLKISPNNRIPAIVDHDGPNGRKLALFESGAILIYLAEKAGKLLAPKGAARYAAIQWLMFQMGGVGPMLGQAHHFRVFAPEKYQYAIDRYTNEAKRLYGVLDRRLGEAPYLAGAEYGIADIATFPWLQYSEQHGVTIGDYPNVQRWLGAIAARPAVQRGMQVLADQKRKEPITDAQREILFGSTQYERR